MDFSSWSDIQKFPFANIRFPPEQTAILFQFEEGMEVEVYTRSNECEACGWWMASIKMLKPDICAVVYIGFDNPYTEIVDIQRIRPKNLNPPITLKTFHQFTIPVPENLRDELVVQALLIIYLSKLYHILCVELRKKEFTRTFNVPLMPAFVFTIRKQMP